MIRNILEHIGGIENYGILSMSLFFVFFFGMLIWALLLRKPFLNEMSQLPLEADPETSAFESNDHE